LKSSGRSASKSSAVPAAGSRSDAKLRYSLIETAKANGIEPYTYLRTVFTELHQATSVQEIEALLPVLDNSAE